MKNYLNFLNETLTKTYSKELVFKYLSTILDKDEFGGTKQQIFIEANTKNHKKIYDIYKKIINLYNWYFIGLECDMDDDCGDDRKQEIDNIEYMSSDEFDIGDGEFHTTLFFQPYFTEKETNIPDLLYHQTQSGNKGFISSIKKQGLVPYYKDITETDYRPDRIYFYKDMNDALNYLYTDDNKSIVVVSTKNLNIDFYKDIEDNSIFTYDNISPDFIEEIIDVTDFKNNLDKFNI